MTFFAIIWSVAVFCNAPGPPGDILNASFYNPYSQAIVLSADVCDVLNTAPRKHHRWSYYGNETVEVENALFILAHEEGHAHDPGLILTTDWLPPYLQACGQVGPCEAYADCYGLRYLRAMARTLGFSGYNSRRLSRYAYRDRSHLGYTTIPGECWYK